MMTSSFYLFSHPSLVSSTNPTSIMLNIMLVVVSLLNKLIIVLLLIYFITTGFILTTRIM